MDDLALRPDHDAPALDAPAPDTYGVPAAVDAYLQRIGRIPLLTAEEEVELGRRVRRGPRASEAHGRLVTANLRLVVHQARRLPRGDVPLLDLVQEGNVGLMMAATRFDPELGFRFSTYAHDWIAQALWAALASDRLVRLPPRAGTRLAHCRRARERLWDRQCVEPDHDQLAAATGYSSAQVAEVLRADVATLPLGEAATLVAGEDPAVRALHVDVAARVGAALERLPADEREVLRWRFGFGSPACSLAETARRAGLQVSRVRRLESDGLARLRTLSGLDGLR